MRDFGSDFGAPTHTRETTQGVSGAAERPPPVSLSRQSP
jgi:hypothetical protein